MNPNPKTMDEVVSAVRETVEHIGERLDANEDWLPVMIAFGKTPAILPLPMIGDPDCKDLVAQVVIPGAIKQAKPDFIVLVTMGWMVQYDGTTLEGVAAMSRDEVTYGSGDIARRPNKEEVMNIFVISKDGAERQELAYVHRNPTLHPVLQWRDDISLAARIEGRFPDALRAGMQQAWKGEK